MASRQRQRVRTGRTGGSRSSGQARPPPSAHLKRATSTAKSILSSRGRSNNNNNGPSGVKRPVGRMKPIDFSDLERQDNAFRVPTPPKHLAKFTANLKDPPARTKAELLKKRERHRRPYLNAAVDIDGDGIVDEIEMQLSNLLDTLEGEDLDGDGVVTEEELMATKVKKGKEILARNFLQTHPNVRDFWSDFRGMNDEAVIRSITKNADYRMLMSNLTNKAMQYELLYDSHRIGDSLRIMATDRERRWQKKKAQLADTRKKLFEAKLNATINAHRRSHRTEKQFEKAAEERSRPTFTPLLNPSFKQQQPGF